MTLPYPAAGGWPRPLALGTGDIDTMQAMASIRIPGTSMTPLLACLFSEASGCRSIFTGKERDAESGNDYFGARYYASNSGRFLTPDWSAVPWNIPYSNLANPQSLDLYVYGANNPLRFQDLDGHYHQQCDPDTSSVQGDAVVVRGGGCHNVPDPLDYIAILANSARNRATQAWQNARQTWRIAMKLAKSPRGRTLRKGAMHLGLAAIKAKDAVGSAALAIETDGATVYPAAYYSVGAMGEFTAGEIDLLGSSNGSDADQAAIGTTADAFADETSTVSGAVAIMATNNVDTANQAAAVENIIVTGGESALTGEPLTIWDWAEQLSDANDLSGDDDQ